LPRPTTARVIPRRRLSVGPQPDRSLGTAAYLARNSTESSERRFRKNSPVVSSEGGWGSQPEMAGEARGKRYARRFRAEGSPFRILESPILHRNAAPSCVLVTASESRKRVQQKSRCRTISPTPARYAGGKPATGRLCQAGLRNLTGERPATRPRENAMP